MKVLLVLLVSAGILFAGCSGGQSETSGEGGQAPTPTETPSGESGGAGSSPYDTANEISPPPELQEIHSMIKPILESVFGGAKLTGYVSGQGVGGQGISLIYVVKEPTTVEKIHVMTDKIKSKGYSSVYGGIQGDGFGFAFEKDNKMLMIGGTLNEYEIAVVGGS